jgi:hypothetical protein
MRVASLSMLEIYDYKLVHDKGQTSGFPLLKIQKTLIYSGKHGVIGFLSKLFRSIKNSKHPLFSQFFTGMSVRSLPLQTRKYLAPVSAGITNVSGSPSSKSFVTLHLVPQGLLSFTVLCL